jgi:predicted nucleotidyltransferase
MKNIKLPEYLDELLKKIWEETEPVSIFLYGSMVRDDFENDSDYEVGIIYERDKKWSRQKLSEFHDYKNVKIYPFVEEELENGEIDTPFPKAIYLQTLLQENFLVHGKKIKEIIKNSKINKEDLLESVGFCLGRAYSAVVSSRQKDWIAVRDNFTKSAFYGLQILVFIKTGRLIFSYKEIQEKAKDLLPEEYKKLIDHVIEVRNGDVVVNTPLLYKNISFFNKVVLKEIRSLGL